MNLNTKENQSNGILHTANEKIKNVGNAIENAGNTAKKEMGEAADVVSDQVSRSIHATRSYIRMNPLQSIALAMATGIAAGTILSFTRSKKQ